MAKLFTLESRDRDAIRDSYLRTIKNGLIARGVPAPDVTPGGDEFLRGQALANELVVIEAAVVIKADEGMPDTANIAGLRRMAGPFGVSEQGAAGSVGAVVITASAASTIATGAQLLDDVGLRYQVTIGGIYDDGDSVPIGAIDTGDATNHAEGDVLRWVSAPPFCDEKALVGAGGLVNGHDADDTESFRDRFFARLRNAPRSGNPQHLIEFAEAATPAVQKAFSYPTEGGPGTWHVAVTAAPTETSKERDVESVTVSGLVAPYVRGLMPPIHPDGAVVTSVANVNADVAFGIIVPEAPTANPPGLGGGWLNGTPWPAPDGINTFRCQVTAIGTSTEFEVDAQGVPSIGLTRIAWLSPFDWTLYTGVVTSRAGGPGAWTITVDKPFVGIAVGCLIWPEPQNAQTYVDAALAAFARMGPGEKTANASALLRGFRHPRMSEGWPSTLGPHLLAALTRLPEVAAAQFLHRTDGTTTLTGSAGVVTPAVPSTIADPPKLLIPRHLALYRAP